MTELTDNTFDCVIVGAGLAGLISARNLHRAGLNVVVIEARERIGGRMHRDYISSGHWIDRGGQWVGPTQHRFLALLDEYGLRRFTSPAFGKNVLIYDGKRYEFDGFFQGFPEGEAPGVSEEDWQDAMQAWKRFEELCKVFPPGHPIPDEKNRELDSRTFADWIADNTHTAFGAWYFSYMARAVGFLGPTEPNQVSLLHVLWGQNCAPQAEHPEAELIHGGAGQIPPLIAAELEGKLRLGEPALRIYQDDEGVEVETAKGRYRGKFVIVAMPPHLSGRILYTPALPSIRQQLTQRVPMGSCAKVHVSYSHPFWRDKGLAGIALGNCQTIELCADSSDPETGLGLMVAFVAGDRYKDWRALSDVQRRSAILADLALYFGEEALSPSTYDEMDWPSEPWTGGGYAAFMPPGVWTSFGPALTEPIGRIYWAGTEMAEVWPGFFEGAIRTAEKAVSAIMYNLEAPSHDG